MPLLACIAPTDPSHPDILSLVFFLVSIFYSFCLFLYSVIPTIRYYAHFQPLPRLNRWTRNSISFSLAFKFLSRSLGVIVGFFVPSSDRRAMYVSGQCLNELPSSVITTCFSLLLLFWLSVCAQILPRRYAPRFQAMRVILIVFNIVFYVVFLTVVIIDSVLDTSEKSQDIRAMLGGTWPLVRDFGFSVILCVFVVHLKHRMTDSSQTGATIDETQLVRVTGMLIVSILARGAISLAQGLAYASPESTEGKTDKTTECSLGIWIMFLVQDLILEGVPFIVLIRANTEYLKEQKSYAENSTPLYAKSIETAYD
jgi:hypothetical protein